MSDKEEPSGTSHLFERLSSKEDDLFGAIANPEEPSKTEPEKIEEEDLIAQIDAIEIETSQAISASNSEPPEVQKPPEKSIVENAPMKNDLSDDLKDDIRSFWIHDETLDRIFKLRAENHTISNNDFDLICQVSSFSAIILFQ